MKVFISHQLKDATAAKMVYDTLRYNGIEAYLDLLDSALLKDGRQLTSHIVSKIGESTDVIAVVSDNTKESWWVPFEIGVATDKPRPIATFICKQVSLPEYLDFWPHLYTTSDIVKYVQKRQGLTYRFLDNTMNIFESIGRRKDRIAEFYTALNNEIHWRP